MDADSARTMARGVGILTTGIGAALLAAPERLGPPVGIDDLRGLRVVGVADLALTPGLIAGRPSWPWMAARGALNVAIGAWLLRQDGPRPRAIAAALAAVTVQDARVAATLRAAGR